DVSPRPMPWRSLKACLCRSRTAWTAVMSISLNVVSIAAVLWASTRRFAMVARRFDMRTRSSVRSPAGRGGRSGFRSRSGRFREGGFNVPAHDATRIAGALDLLEIDGVLLGGIARRGRGARLVGLQFPAGGFRFRFGGLRRLRGSGLRPPRSA